MPVPMARIIGIRSRVPTDGITAAASAIQALDATELQRYQQNLYQCPMCGSKKVGENYMRFAWLLLLTLLTFGLYLTLFYRRHRCLDCGSVW